MSFSSDNVTESSLHMHTVCTMYVSKHYVLKRTYGVHNVRNVCMPDTVGDVISGIGIGIGIAVPIVSGIRHLHGIGLTLLPT